MKGRSIFLFFLSALIIKTSEGKTFVEQVVLNPSFPVAAAKQLGLNISGGIKSSELMNTADAFSSTGVNLPDVHCSATDLCSRFEDPRLICVNGQCTCKAPDCWVYHFESTGWSSKNVFACDTCGQLGSWCNASYTCDLPGECWSDGYCHCPEGEHYDGICVVVDQSWAYKFTLIGFGSMFLIAVLIICFHFYRNRPWDQPGPWCCGLCKKSGGGTGRRGSCVKTPAFTVQNLYMSQISDLDTDVTAGPSDREVQPSTSTQGQQQEQRPRIQRRKGRKGRGDSVISVETVTTSLSTSSIYSQESKAGPSSDTSSEGASSLPSDVIKVTKSIDDEVVNSNRPRPSTSDDETSSVSTSSSCTHDRCKLCLPKGLSSRPKKGGPSGGDPGCSSASSEPQDTPVASDLHPKVEINMEGVSGGVEVEYTATHL